MSRSIARAPTNSPAVIVNAVASIGRASCRITNPKRKPRRTVTTSDTTTMAAATQGLRSISRLSQDESREAVLADSDGVTVLTARPTRAEKVVLSLTCQHQPGAVGAGRLDR